jgi:protein-tyrosine phosphatase
LFRIKFIFFLFKNKNVAVESSSIVYPKSIKLEKYDIIDFPTAPICNYFNSLTDKIHAHLNANNQNKVLVHCMAGISRSNLNQNFSILVYSYFLLRYNHCLCLSYALYGYVVTRCIFIM